MDVGAFQPVKNISQDQLSNVVQGFGSPFALDESALGAFDLLFQQLLTDSAQPTGLSSDGSFLPLLNSGENPVAFAQSFFNPESDLLLETEQLGGYLQQFNFSELPEGSIPSILQELQAVFQDATSLGQGQIDLQSILSQATPEQGVDLLNFIGSQNSTGLNQVQTALRDLLQTQVSTEGTAGENQTQPTPTLGELLVQVTEEKTAVEKTAVFQRLPQAELIQQLLGARPEFIDAIGARNPRPVSTDQLMQTLVNPSGENNPFANFTLPDYLNPEMYGQPELQTQTQQLVQQLRGREALEAGIRQVFSQNSERLEQSLMDALGLNEGVSGGTQSDVGTGTSSHLNLTDQSNQQIENAGAVDGEVKSAETTSVNFNDNLKRLQEAQAVIDQISKNFHLRQAGNVTEMTFGLQPEHLGQLNLKVQMTEGAVSVNIVADKVQVREVLESNMAALRNSLENSDVKVDRLDVTLADDSEDFLADAHQMDGGADGKEASSNADDRPDFDFAFDGELEKETNKTSEGPSLRDRIHQINAVA